METENRKHIAQPEPKPVLAEVADKILKLSLYKKAFDVMVTGEKKLEFRKPSRWIESRLFKKDGSVRSYDLIKFTNGYGSDKPYFICRYEGMSIEYGYFQYSNGLEVDVNNDFAIKCGEIIEIGNVRSHLR